MPVNPIPEGYHSVTPYLIVKDVNGLIDFLKRAFDAEEIGKHTDSDGAVMHAEVRIGDSVVMMGEASDEWRPMPSVLHLYVEDTDAVYQRAMQAGATSLREPSDQFYGDRSGGVTDPSDNQWWIATHVEDVPPEELKRRQESFESSSAS